MSYSWLNFGDDPAGILDSESLWNFRYHCVKAGIAYGNRWQSGSVSNHGFLGHVELGYCGKCNYSLKRVGEMYTTIW